MQRAVTFDHIMYTVFPHSFFNLEIQRSQYIRPKVTVHKCAETIQGREIFKGGNTVCALFMNPQCCHRERSFGRT